VTAERGRRVRTARDWDVIIELDVAARAIIIERIVPRALCLRPLTSFRATTRERAGRRATTFHARWRPRPAGLAWPCECFRHLDSVVPGGRIGDVQNVCISPTAAEATIGFRGRWNASTTITRCAQLANTRCAAVGGSKPALLTSRSFALGSGNNCPLPARESVGRPPAPALPFRAQQERGK
jgi:hypothetical protein